MSRDPLARYVSRRDHDGFELRIPTRPHQRQGFPAVVLAAGLVACCSILALPAVESALAAIGWEFGRSALSWDWIGACVVGLAAAVAGWVALHPPHLRLEITSLAVRLERIRRPPLVVRLTALSRVRTDATGLWLEERGGSAHHVELPGWRADEREGLAEQIRDQVERAHRTAGSAAEVPRALSRLRRRETEGGP